MLTLEQTSMIYDSLSRDISNINQYRLTLRARGKKKNQQSKCSKLRK
jgi:hypothetical protein